MRRNVSSERGFTIIEVLVVIMIMGVLLAIAAPSFRMFTASQKVKTASFDLYAALVFARSEAIKRRKCISVTPTSSSDWTTGWSVSEVASAPPTCTLNVADPKLRTQDALTGVVTAGASSIVYRLDGRLNGGATVGVLIQSQLADPSIQNRCVRVDLTGLPRTTSIAGTTCP